MTQYNPDKWVVVKITSPSYPTVYKVFACWYGGYTGADSWKLNSGITSVSVDEYVYTFTGSSGSEYICDLDCYGTNFYGGTVLDNMIDKSEANGGTIQILSQDTDWLLIDYT